MRTLRLVSVVAVICALVGQSAHAASPSGGTLTKKKRSVKWTGGPFTLSFADAGGGCEPPTEAACDHFALKVNLGDGATVRVKVTTPSANSQGGVNIVQGDDYDLYVHAPDGSLIADSSTESGNEKLEFKHRARFNGKAYDVGVNPWGVRPGSTYKGTAEALTTGR